MKTSFSQKRLFVKSMNKLKTDPSSLGVSRSSGLISLLESSSHVNHVEKEFKKQYGRDMNESEHEANIIFHAFLAVLNSTFKK
nr:hypothetical protein [Sulfurospirillum sp. 'SP']